MLQPLVGLPDLRSGESLATWRDRTSPNRRDPDEVTAELDLHCCMTWGLADANLNQQPMPGEIEQFAIWQRRRALEYAFASRTETSRDWDDVDLST